MSEFAKPSQRPRVTALDVALPRFRGSHQGLDLGGTYRRYGDRTTMPRANVRDRLGRVTDADVIRLDRALLVLLGLAECLWQNRADLTES